MPAADELITSIVTIAYATAVFVACVWLLFSRHQEPADTDEAAGPASESSCGLDAHCDACGDRPRIHTGHTMTIPRGAVVIDPKTNAAHHKFSDRVPPLVSTSDLPDDVCCAPSEKPTPDEMDVVSLPMVRGFERAREIND